MTERVQDRPDLSLVMPCYNEEEVVPYTIPQLVTAFAEAGWGLQLVAVDNGSRDRTPEILREFVAAGHPVVPVTVEANVGYGNGVLAGVGACDADWIGFIPADGQVDAEDVVRLFESVRVCKPATLAKARRRFRMDGVKRKIVSILYNGLVYCMWPGLGSIDVNGSPKILHRTILDRMDLRSRQWFLDPEMMIKAHYMGVRVLETNVFARMRGNGLSHVRPSTCWEFFRDLLACRFGGRLREWKRGVRAERKTGHEQPAAEETPAA